MRVLIVGAGPGGLAAAINLAGQGFQVTVVEKESIPGGRMRGLSLESPDGARYQLDSGPSILQLPQILKAIFARAGKRTEDYVTLMPVHPNTRVHFWDGTHLDTSTDPARMDEGLRQLSPELPAAMRRWLVESKARYEVAYEKFMATPADSLSYYAPWRLWRTLRFKPWQSLYRHLYQHFRDDRVVYALAYPSKYLGLHPTTCSSVFSVIPYLELAFGVWHVRGGFRALAQGMKRCAEDLGATFRMGAPVKRVVVENGVARGVELESGERLTADAVVVNADLGYAATTLIPSAQREGSELSDRALAKAQYSCSTFMMYLGLDRKYALPHHLIYLSEHARRTDRASLRDEAPDLDDPPFYVCNPGATDPSGAPEGHSTLYVLVPCPNTQRAVDWTDTRAKLTERIPGWLSKVGLDDVARHIRAQTTFTAETWRDDFNVHHGAVFNLSHNWTQLGPLRPQVQTREIANLYWVGGGTHPGSGLLTILESANIAANYLTQEAKQGPLPEWPFVPRAA